MRVVLSHEVRILVLVLIEAVMTDSYQCVELENQILFFFVPCLVRTDYQNHHVGFQLRQTNVMSCEISLSSGRLGHCMLYKVVYYHVMSTSFLQSIAFLSNHN